MINRLVLDGLERPATVTRDRWGIPHMQAGSASDAFFVQGFVHAQDRLWQMDFDRRRGAGRWAEVAGLSGVPQDRLMRSFKLAESSRTDYAQLRKDTREMFDAYARGVNAYLGSGEPLPPEYRLIGMEPEPWEPWQSMAVYKVRHVLMGVWEGKLFRARLVSQAGPEVLKALYPAERQGDLLILPPGGTYEGAVAMALDELAAAAGAVAWLKDDQGGSNNWVVSGTRTASGLPLMAGDPHRAVDVPSVYYQNHLACDDFDVVGLSFPGLPGFPHFGHNREVAWCITHTGADIQDLFVEQFHPQDPTRYLFRDEWLPAEVRRETIRVRGAADQSFDLVVTHHGPVIAGKPASGHAVSMRYTATTGENPGWDCLLPMLKARSCAEFDGTMRGWVDPVNNLLYADVHGANGYRMRGRVPVRPAVNGWLPVPGWTGEHEWHSMIPFEELPALLNPDTGFIITANNRVVGEDYPYYIALQFTAEYRARRIHERLLPGRGLTVDDMAAIHGDVLSLCALKLKPLLGHLQALSPEAAAAASLLQSWDGEVRADLAAPAIYNLLREELVAAVLKPLLGPLFPEAFSPVGRGGPLMVATLRRTIFDRIRENEQDLLPPGAAWSTLLTAALERSVAQLRERFGPDMAQWQWGQLHQVRSLHPLAPLFPGEEFSPPPVPMDGDGDTVQAASYHPGSGFTVSGSSVARYVFDVADWDRSAWVVPHGSSGRPGTLHFLDQADTWRSHRLIPMLYSWERVAAEAESRSQLVPR